MNPSPMQMLQDLLHVGRLRIDMVLEPVGYEVIFSHNRIDRAYFGKTLSRAIQDAWVAQCQEGA